MNPTDPRAQAAFDAAIHHIKTTTAAVAERVATHLGLLASAANKILERDALINAQLDLRRNMSTFVLFFGDSVSKKVSRELNPASEPGRRLADTDWQSLSLVDDGQVEEQMFANRISQTITHGCEWELRELAAYTGALLNIGRADHDRNPLRPEVLGEAIYKAICGISNEAESRKLLCRELSLGMTRAMPTCYADILKDFRARGVLPVSLTVRGVEGPGSDRVISGYGALARDSGQSTRSADFSQTFASEFDGSMASGAGAPNRNAGGWSGAGQAPGGASQFGQANARPEDGTAGNGHSNNSERNHGTGQGSPPGGNPRNNPSSPSGATPSGRQASGNSGPGRFTPRAGVSPQADAELMSLIRRLTFLASRPAELGPGSVLQGLGADTGNAPLSGTGSLGGSNFSGGGSAMGRPSGMAAGGMMAVNLIRAHRDELRQASTGTLDHMVIDVVGSLFDQILSDPRVPPQMARQIARLQLPVLRVALSDNAFFSSRKHPVRRFVNRIASLACAFDEFDEGPGKDFLARVADLVQEIVQGDFDQIEVYSAKLATLENFIANQAKEDVQQSSAAASVVDTKESDLRTQQRYMLQLQAALAPLSLQEYLRSFLSQVWSQALAHGTRTQGAQSELVQRLKRAGRDLVMSVQPKGSPAMRKKFLLQLPGLMKDLNEGMGLIGWPEAAQKEFFGKLLPAHADSLKGHPLTELEYNLLAKQLESVFNTPVPQPDGLLRDVPLTTTGSTAIEATFTPEEAKQIGLIDESAVDWSGEVDIDLSAPPEPEEPPVQTDAAPSDINVDLDKLGLDLDLSTPDAADAPPTQGAHLIDHLRLGFAYQMHLHDEWQKVRLSYVSPGRAFFVFTRGKRHTETVSLTARMLARMCESGRFRAYESAYLMERATARARKQLAALTAKSKAAATEKPGLTAR